MSGSRNWRDKGYEFTPFIPKKKEPRIPVPQRPVVVDQEAAERRRDCIRRFYETRDVRDRNREIVLPTREEFNRAVYGEEEPEDPALRSLMERIVREVLEEEEIKIGNGEKVGPEDSEKKDSTPNNDKEEDGDVVKGEMMKSETEIQEADKKGHEVKTMVDEENLTSAAVACKNGDEGIAGNAEVKLEGAISGPGGEEEPVGAEIEAEAPVPEAEQEVPAAEAKGQAVAAAAIDGQNGNEGIPEGQEGFVDFQVARARRFGYLIRRLRR